ncbi:MAG TPA: hypothetical protein VLV16_13785 [Gemmatimonadales bacterium]|nr:hypothetical protein [Gemmatimonadales bacterium]
MLLALTRRAACRQALLEVVSALPGWQNVAQRAVFVASFAEANLAPRELSACVVDMESVTGPADDIVASIRRFVASRPWLNVVLLVQHVHPDLEAEVIFGLRDLPGLALIQPGELRDAERWNSVLRDQFVERHALMIEADLRAASPAKSASFFADPQIRDLLRLGARVRRVSDLAAVAQRDRVGMWRRFKRRWGRPPSEMLTLFRVIWAAHLQHHGHSNAEVAGLLGFRDAHHFARRLGARLGLSKTVLNSLSYADVVSGVAACLARRAPVSTLLRRAATLHHSA